MPLSTVPNPDSPRRGSRLSTLHSLAGAVLAVYVVWHLSFYARAMSGEPVLTRAVSRLSSRPWLLAVVAIAVLGVLGLHAAYGIKLMADKWKAGSIKALQRATGIAVLAFLAYHVVEFEIPLLSGSIDAGEIYPRLAQRLSSTAASIPIHAWIYLLAVLAVSMHACIGAHSLCVSTGLAVSPRSRKIAAGLIGVAGFALLLLGSDIVIYFAAGERFFVPNAIVRPRPLGSADCDPLLLAPPPRR